MSGAPIGMNEMRAVFGVIDELAISREKVEVPLLPEGEGAIRRLPNGKLEITLPTTQTAAEWIVEMRERIATVGEDLLGTGEETA